MANLLKSKTSKSGIGDPFELPVKRFYLPGNVIEETCKCGGTAKLDLGRDYLSFPDVNEPYDVGMYCNRCDGFIIVKILLKLNLELV